MGSSGIERTAHGEAAFAQDVCVYHGGLDVLVPKEFLDGPDIIAILQQVGGETVSEGVTTDGFIDASQFDSPPDGLLHAAFREVMAAHDAGAGICGVAFGGENVLPAPFCARSGIFSPEHRANRQSRGLYRYPAGGAS